MEQYIKKSALVAEIERLKNTSLEYGYNTMQRILADSGKDISLAQLQHFLDTIEVKEVQEEPISNDLKEAAVEAFKQIVDSDKNNFLEIFKAGTEWQKQQTISKACKWIEEKAARYLVDRFVGSTRVVGIDTSITEDFRKDMEDEDKH